MRNDAFSVLFMLVSTLCSSVAFTQPFAVSWGNSFETFNAKPHFRLIEKKGQGFLLLEEEWKEFTENPVFLNFLDENHTLVSRKEVKVVIGGKSYFSDRVVALESGYIVFVIIQEKNKNGKVYALYGAKLDNDLVQQSLQKLDEFAKRKDMEAPNPGRDYDYSRDLPYCGVKLSEDKTGILLYIRQEVNRLEKESFTYRMVDTDLNEIWSKRFEMPYKHTQIDVRYTDHVSLGNYWGILNAEVPDRYHVLVKFRNYETTVLHLYNAQSEQSVMQNLECRVYATRLQNDGTYQMVGIKENGFMIPELITEIRSNLHTMVIDKLRKIEISADEIKTMADPRFFKEGERIGYAYANQPARIIEVLPKPDGGYYIVYENTYYDRLVTVISVNQDFQSEWDRKIAYAKPMQGALNTPGFGAMCNVSGIYLFYQDHAQAPQADVIAVTHINKEGKAEKNVCCDQKIDTEFVFNPWQWVRFDSGELLFYAKVAKKVKFGAVR